VSHYAPIIDCYPMSILISSPYMCSSGVPYALKIPLISYS